MAPWLMSSWAHVAPQGGRITFMGKVESDPESFVVVFLMNVSA